MVVRREKKRRRGERTYHGRHGYPRGGGSRGGRGNAGLHKHKWIRTLKYNKEHFGKKGFTSPRKKYKWQFPRVINIGKIDEKIEEFVKLGIATKKDNTYIVDVGKLNVDKILGNGKLFHKLVLKNVKEISKKAKEKIESLGGKII